MNHKHIHPVISEKSLFLASKGWYTFAVPALTRKRAIAKEVDMIYSVSVKAVRTMIMHGKTKRVGKRQTTKMAQDWKKAFVRLSKGQTIPAFEVTSQEEKK